MTGKKSPISLIKKPLIIIISALCSAHYAGATDINWQGGSSDSWHDMANWNMGTPDNAGNNFIIKNGPVINITQATDEAKRLHSSDATLNIINGGQLFAEQVRLGDEAGTTTTILVSGAGSSISNAGTVGATWHIGANGNTVITIENGGQLINKGTYPNTVISLGENDSASGTIIAKGATLDGNGDKIAAIDTDTLIRVGNGGTGTLHIIDGALANIKNLHLGHYANSHGSVLVSGQGSTLNTAKEFVVGYGGSGSLIIENGGVVNSGGTGQIRGSANSRALVTGQGSAWNVSNVFVINDAFTEGVQQRLDIRDGGAVNVKNGSFIISRLYENSEGVLTVADRGSILNVSSDNGTPVYMFIGSGNKATMQVTNGGEVYSPDTYAGHELTGAANILVSDADSRWINSGKLYLGVEGQTSMTVHNQGYVESGTSGVGWFDSGKGEVLLNDRAHWSNLGDMTIGRMGTGIVTLSNNANLTVGGVLTIGAEAGGKGTLNIGSALGYAAVDAGTLSLDSIVLGNIDSTGINAGGDAAIIFNHTAFDGNGYSFNANTSGYGTVVVHSGITQFNGLNTYSGITEIHGQGVARAGNENTFSDQSDYRIDAGGWLDMAGYNQTLGNTTHAGLITFHTDTNANNDSYNRLTIDGDYHGDNGTIVYNTKLAANDAPTDLLVVMGNTSGTTQVKVINAGGAGAETQNGIKLVDVRGDSNGTFALQGRAVAGSYEYFLHQGGVETPADGDWYLRSSLNTPTPSPSIYRPEASGYMANMAAAGKLFNLRLEDREGRAENSSMWLRQAGSRLNHRDNSDQLHTSTNSYVIQGGGEVGHVDTSDTGRAGLGVMLGYGYAKSNSDSQKTGYRADSTVKGYSAGVYGTWYQDASTLNGAYVDSWVQYSWLDASVKGQQVANESYDMSGFSASLEAGYRIPVYEGVNSRVYLTPQGQAVWSGITPDTHYETNGTRVTSSGDNNVQTRLGLKISRDGLSDIDKGKEKLFTVYAEANWLYNSEQAGATLDGVTVSQAGSRNVGELKLGSEGQLNRNLNLWTNVAQQLGDKGYSDTTVNLGIKYRF